MTQLDTSAIREGVVLANKYRIERVLGVGGMGMVVAAHHLQLDERVAIKLLLPEMLTNPDAVERFAREARAAIKIKSEHVVRIMDVSSLESGAPLMVMEYLQGSDLADLIQQHGALPATNVVDYVLQACHAVGEAHGLGIVHRDLKPANLFVTQRNDGTTCVKVLDFGISKFTPVGGRALNMTSTQSVMGSPLYMSPEQMSSAKHVDLRTDIWALGVILHEALTGKPPFEGESITQLVACVLTTNPPSLRSCRADLAEGLEPVVLRCLQKNPAARFQSVRELAEALAPFAPAAARDRVPSIGNVTGASQGWAAPPVHAGATTENGEVALPLQSRTPLWIGLGLLAAVLGVGASLAAVMALRSGGAQAAPPGVTPPVPATAASAPGAVAPAEPFVTAAASSVPVRVAPPPAGVQPAGTRSGASGSKTAASAIASTVATAQLVAPPANTPAPTPTAAPPKKGGDLDMFNDNH